MIRDRHRPMLRLAVIGGGISGLAAAHRLGEIAPSAKVTLLEAGERLGGVLSTTCRDRFLIERGADNFITTVPWAMDLCRRLGFQDDLIPTNSAHRRAFVVRRGTLRPIPAGFVIMAPSRLGPVVTTPILSPLGKLRLASELWVRRRVGDEDESLAAFVSRRFGRETYERLVQPLVAGIYTADPEKLSIGATMPRFVEMEREHGSLIRAMWHEQKVRRSNEKDARNDRGSGAGVGKGNDDAKATGARYSQFVAPRNGMSSLVDAIAARLTSSTIRLNAPVERIAATANTGWKINVGGEQPHEAQFDGILLASPAHHSAELLQEAAPKLAGDLRKIKYGSCAILTLGFRKEQIRHALDGFGFVVPLIECRQILSASFSSIKYVGRAPDGSVLIRVFMGGACQAELLDLPDDRLLDIATQELADLLGIEGPPMLSDVSRRVRAMPQYHVGHPSLVKQISLQADQLPNFALASNALQGVGIPHCIHTAEIAAQQLVAKTRSASMQDPADV